MNESDSPRIRTEDAVRFFGSKAALARALSIAPQAITSWGEYVPDLRAFQLRESFPTILDREAAASRDPGVAETLNEAAA